MVVMLALLACVCASASGGNAPVAVGNAVPSGGVGAPAPTATPPPAPSTSVVQGAPSADSETPRAGDSGTFTGLCEASGLAVHPDGGWVLVDNETSDRVYRFDVDMKRLPDLELEDPIEDLEALTVLPSGVVVVFGSQGTNRAGKPRPRRERATVVGKASRELDLASCAPCRAARGIEPEGGGLNVEGAAWWGGRYWLGLRSPLDGKGRAWLVSLGDDLYGPVLPQAPIAVDLGGEGIRELAPWNDGLLVVSGPAGSADTLNHLWWLAAPDAAPVRLAVALPASTEGIAVIPDPAPPGPASSLTPASGPGNAPGDGVAEGGRAPLPPQGEVSGDVSAATVRLRYVTDGDGKPGAVCKVPATWGTVEVVLP